MSITRPPEVNAPELLESLVSAVELVRTRQENPQSLARELLGAWPLVEIYMGFLEVNRTTWPQRRQYLREVLRDASRFAGIDAVIDSLLVIDAVTVGPPITPYVPDPNTTVNNSTAWYLAYEALEPLQEWPMAATDSPRLGLLTRELYEALDRNGRFDRGEYLIGQLGAAPDLSPAQTDLGRVLAEDWVGTLPDLLDTLRALCPDEPHHDRLQRATQPARSHP